MDESLTFGKLLLGHRRAAGLTQVDLAEASGMSVRALRDLERGHSHAAQRRSAQALADALGLDGDDRELFLAVAREGRRRARTPDLPRPSELPPAVPDLLGREDDLARLRSEIASGAGVIAIIGYPGVGKTALAVWAAHRLRDEFPDGCFAVDLRGMDERPVTSREALDQLLRALGVAPQRIPSPEAEQSALLRSVVAGRRVLVLLDNAADEAQVRPLLAAGPGSLILITCRQALAGLESARWVWLDPLHVPDAADLLASIVGQDRVRAEPDAAAELIRLCGSLPLAVRIAGNRLATRPHWSIAYLVTQLQNERTRLSSLSAGDLQVRLAFEMSYRRLSPAARLVFRRLAALPGSDFGISSAAVATSITEPDVHAYLDELIDASLVQSSSTPGRFRFHDLIRLFARERWEAEDKPGDRKALSTAVLEYLIGTATEAGMVSRDGLREGGRFSSRREAVEWLDREVSSWLAAHREAARLGWDREVMALAEALFPYSWGRSQGRPWVEMFTLGVEAARRLGSPEEQVRLLNFTGTALSFSLGDNEEGLVVHREALKIALEIPEEVEEGRTRSHLARTLLRLGRPEEALRHAGRAMEIAPRIGLWEGQCMIRNVMGSILTTLGRYEEALSVHREVLAAVGDYRHEAKTDLQAYPVCEALLGSGHALAGLGQWRQAAKTYREARMLFRDNGFHVDEAESALSEGIALREAGAPAEARKCLRFALAILTGMSGMRVVRQRERALAELARTPEDHQTPGAPG
ncbi:ATP-binding protein [Amycolatopsis pigmentata]|uniref:ATP-binding protein n=1 Tax=Amycolatopsis pigmentata TaxID=450801 RepID=A0ABW5FR98_9PSEU